MSPDWTRCAVAAGLGQGHEGMIFLIDTATGEVVRSIRAHSRPAASLIYHPDGKRLISSGLDGTIRLWNAETGEELRSYSGQEGNLRAMAFSKDGRWFVASEIGGKDRGRILLWDVEVERAIEAFHPEDGAFLNQAGERRPISAFGDGLLAIPTDAQKIVIWDLEERRIVREVADLGKRIDALCFLEDDSRLLSRGDGQLTVWSLELGKELLSIPFPRETYQYEPLIVDLLDRIDRGWREDYRTRMGLTAPDADSNPSEAR